MKTSNRRRVRIVKLLENLKYYPASSPSPVDLYDEIIAILKPVPKVKPKKTPAGLTHMAPCTPCEWSNT